MAYQDRVPLYQQIEKSRKSKVILYATGDRPGMESQISSDAFDFFVHHLDQIWPAKRITLILHTAGGDTAAAWKIVNLLRIFCEHLEVIIPNRAHSAGTLISLGANEIIMTKQATLGPIDPSLTGPLSPAVPNAPHQRVPVSVEAVQGYIDLARNEMGISNDTALANILHSLSTQVHPLVLGQIFRSRSQIKSLAEALLVHQGIEGEARDKIVDFLCSKSGSHDRTINRREARQLGLKIGNPSEKLYKCINSVYESIVADMESRNRFDPPLVLQEKPATGFACQRGLLESVAGGSMKKMTKGTIRRSQAHQPQAPGMPPALVQTIETTVNFEGWETEA